MRKRRFLVFILLAILAVAVFFLLDGRVGKETKQQGAASTMNVIDEALDVIKKEGVYPVDGDMLVEGALRGMADVIGDPYSTYLSEDEAAAHKESLAAERVGIGAEITRSNGKYIIVSPLKASPADKAGLRPYDEIVRIDGERIDGESLQKVVQRIRGKKGTPVSMTIYRPDDGKHLELTVTRDAIPVKTVSSKVIEERGEKFGYISITTFASETAKEWKTETDSLLKKGIKGLIIDVRGNPGGYLHSVGNIAGSLLKEDTVFAYMQDAKGALTPLVTERAEDLSFDKKLKKVPIILLQDKGSASASEVLSGALKDLKRGFIAGTTSFGKGTVQETFDISNGGEMKLSTHKWLTPKEQWIHGKGVTAEIEVEQNELFNEHIRLITAEYEDGDYHEDIAYGQRLLTALGYVVGREDGYFDASTARAIHEFRDDAKIETNSNMNKAFFAELKKRVEEFRKDPINDDQLQMAIGYIHHVVTE
ncbi:S41 family peptidase [Filibacter tadaridae]|uniref:Carboxy-terminal processing protease CtpB n=1 Tax=Filibacter tadaridae TaxID=2483811 RepID=A0A3P5XG79_9BACL|nr:S41 family peptidase [Filibacter tadaridae]VDC27556.1 Carboxy-terminal processing protease CtpB precursor [Filibacter tadaridae]